VREDQARNVAPARVSPTTKKENDKKRGLGRYPPLEIHPGDELGRASQAYARAVILFDTNVVIDARDQRSVEGAWAAALVAKAVQSEGAAVNAIGLAELYVGQPEGADVESELVAAGFTILDLPAGAAVICGRAYTRYKASRRRSGGGAAPTIPLPDFFIGAHAELMGWSLATRDTERYRRYFPNVQLIEP
jgi:predicted nucleic acid-binding protein